jgi:limonene-1,2-epoxide hydrolase
MGQPNLGKQMNYNRREWMLGASALALLPAACGDPAMDFSELETANETVVNNFCRDWGLRDIDALMPYLAEDLIYQITPGQPLITSAEQFKKQMGPFLSKLEEVNWEILRSHAIGPLVLNERIDHFVAPEGGKAPSMHFHIAGHFLVEDGIIKVWKDWPMPGVKQIVG